MTRPQQYGGVRQSWHWNPGFLTPSPALFLSTSHDASNRYRMSANPTHCTQAKGHGLHKTAQRSCLYPRIWSWGLLLLIWQEGKGWKE